MLMLLFAFVDQDFIGAIFQLVLTISVQRLIRSALLLISQFILVLFFLITIFPIELVTFLIFFSLLKLLPFLIPLFLF